MEKDEEIQRLRTELIELERAHRRLSLEECTKRLDKIHKRLDPLVAEHQRKMKRFEQELGPETYDREAFKKFNEETRYVTRLQMKFYKVQTLVFARHVPEV